MSEHNTDVMRARNSSGLPLIISTCYIFQLDDIVLGVLEREDLINSVICRHNVVATGLESHEVLNLLSDIRDDNLSPSIVSDELILRHFSYHSIS